MGVLDSSRADNIRLAVVIQEREQVVLLLESWWFSPVDLKPGGSVGIGGIKLEKHKIQYSPDACRNF